ncbi:MAG TPA: folylpolyglutamate synthase/dihydrofolate synthase family protein [Candidatus Eisenbacteria bacterium]|jgi:dihydrofolate synthase/folylpolyglutamate synthase|nr:folylpolyglutamate synthase/dihydrofolate synthase family protein [Candidatus Eisenbacteria bacterium]
MNYDDAVRYLLSLGRELAAPTQAAAAKFDLENITLLAERLGRPDRAYPSAHIAGTNGKGSTAAFLESILRCAGFRTGLNTSPHLERINERIRVVGAEISDAAFAETLARIASLIEELLASGKLRAHPTYFESVTAMAFEYFARERVDFGVFEVGLGGRLDATNIVTPVVSMITRIDFDHENFLGHSLAEIAGEKAGILKPAVPAVVAEQRAEARDVILTRAAELGCPVIETSRAFRIDRESMEYGFARARATEIASGWSMELAPNLAGRFQLLNALNAVAAARLLQNRGYRIADEALTRGVATTVWPGRLEKLGSHPDVYLDGAHNPSAARELAAFWEQNFADRKIFLLYGALRDKAVDEVAGLLFPRAAEVIFTEPRTSRAISASQLAEIAAHYAARSSIIADAQQALDYALASATPGDAVFITGSLYLVGQLRACWKQRTQVAAG